MSETGIPCSSHNLYHFIFDSPWTRFKLMDPVSKEVVYFNPCNDFLENKGN